MWYLQRRNTRAVGPVTTEDVVEGIKSGEIPRDTMVCAVDSKQWLPIDSIAELAGAFKAPTSVVVRPVSESAATISDKTIREPPRPRRIQRIESMPRPERARAALAVSGAALALSLIAISAVFVPTASLAALLDSVHALRSTLVATGALGVVAWGTATLAAYGLERGRIEARSLARAAGVPLLVWFTVALAGLVAVHRGFAPNADVVQARTMILSLILAIGVAGGAYASLIGRSLGRGLDRRRDLLAICCVAAASVLVVPGARAVASVTDVFAVEGPLFPDEQTLRKFVEATRDGASGVPLLDEALGTAIFVPKSTRVRYLDEVVLEARGGTFVGRKVLFDGRTAFTLRGR